MEIDLALLADAATIDNSGKLNILGIFDRIDAQGFPAQHGRIALILRFSGTIQDAGAHHLRIRLTHPTGEEMASVEGDLHLGPGAFAEPLHAHHIINMDGLVFPVGGVYSFDVFLDGQAVVSVPITVRGPASRKPAQA